MTTYSSFSFLTHHIYIHRRPQSLSCGLSEFLPRFSYIGSLDRIERQARELLQNVGLWESHGKYYHQYTNADSQTCASMPPKLKVGDVLSGFLQLPKNIADRDRDNHKHSHHSTGSRSKLDQYYTPELRSIVEDKLYSMDLKLWKLVEHEKKLVSGSELAVRLSEQCHTRAQELMGL